MIQHVVIGQHNERRICRNSPQASGWHGLLRRALALCAVLVLAAGCATTSEPIQMIAPPPGSSAKYSALVINAASGETLYQANATATRYPASLTKMMTLYLLFEALDQGRVSKTTEIPVSSFAARQPPSKIGLKTGQSIDVESAILALTVKSGNDCAVAVAEYLGGTEEQFAAADDGAGATAWHDGHGVPQRVRPARSGPAHDGARHGGARYGAALALSAVLPLFLAARLHLSRHGWCAAITI